MSIEKKSVRAVALELLSEYENQGKYVNLSLNSHKADNFTGEERALLTALLYTSVERKLTYDYYISALSGRSVEKIDSYTKNILRLGLCQLLHMDNIPDHAAINESVKLSRHSGERAFVNGILRTAQRQKSDLPLPDKNKNFARYLSIKYSFPLWTVRKYISVFGDVEAEKLLIHFDKIAPTDLTVNTAKITLGDFLTKLEKEGLSAQKSKYSSISLRINKSVIPSKICGYDEGAFFVQDAACAAAVSLLGVKAGEFVIDVCAAPGGKSFAAAILMQGTGRVTSFDIHSSKLSLIEEGAKRLSLDNVSAFVCDATAPKEELFGTADKVICDVPCSGLGVVPKKPDLRYKGEEGVAELPPLQYQILRESAKYLKPGGRLLYSTCTLLPEENEAVVAKFLAENPGFHALDFKIGELESKNGSFTFIPHVHNTDGFFVSLIEKDNI